MQAPGPEPSAWQALLQMLTDQEQLIAQQAEAIAGLVAERAEQENLIRALMRNRPRQMML